MNDPTAKGNSCNDETDPVGCIFTLNLAVPAATEEEILAAVSGVDSGAGNGDDTNVDDGTDGADGKSYITFHVRLAATNSS
mgnify:CR=1 FL=1